MRVWKYLLLYALAQGSAAHALAIPMDDEPWIPADQPVTPRIAPERASRIETVRPAPPRKPERSAPAAAPSTPPKPDVASRPTPASQPEVTPPPRRETPANRGAAINPPTTPAALTTAATDKTPEKPKFTCSGRTNEVKQLISQTIDTEVFDLTWSEDTPVVGGSARFRMFNHGGDAQIEMINSSGESVGISPAKVCLTTAANGKKALRVSLQMARLNLGFFAGAKIRGLLQQTIGRTDEFPIVLTASSQRGKIDIQDGADGSMIRSAFTPARASQ